MMHFTGSTRAVCSVSSICSCKRVTQELGGKSANIILGDADIEKVAAGVSSCFKYGHHVMTDKNAGIL